MRELMIVLNRQNTGVARKMLERKDILQPDLNAES
jgi:hypothetical protein